MAQQNNLKAQDQIKIVKHGFKLWWQEIKDLMPKGNGGPKTLSDKITNYVFYAALVGAVAWGGYQLYGMYTRSKEQAAHAIFAEYTQEYERALKAQEEDWTAIETLFKKGYEQHSGSRLAPYFLAYQAEALLKQNKKQEAFTALNMAVNAMRASEIKPLYEIKRALLQLDMADQDTQNKGHEFLRKAANDPSNKYSDIAAYYLGLYSWTTNHPEQAKSIWEPLVAMGRIPDQKKRSPWGALVEPKMQQVK